MTRRLAIKIVGKSERCGANRDRITIRTDEGTVYACVRGYKDTIKDQEKLIRAADRALAQRRS